MAETKAGGVYLAADKTTLHDANGNVISPAPAVEEQAPKGKSKKEE